MTILQEKQELRGADGAVCCFTVTLARSAVTFDDASLLKASVCASSTSMLSSLILITCNLCLLFCYVCRSLLTHRLAMCHKCRHGCLLPNGPDAINRPGLW